jgi:hypothetical protein
MLGHLRHRQKLLVDGLQGIYSLLKLHVIGWELRLAGREQGPIGECQVSYFGICLSQLLFDILLSPGSEGGESRTTECQRKLFQLGGVLGADWA